jgi:hypothetical protein
MTDNKCHVAGSPVDAVRAVYRNETHVIQFRFEPQDADYAQLLVDALKRRVNLEDVCPVRSVGDPDPSAYGSEAIFWKELESTDKMTVLQPQVSGNWSRLTVGSNVDLAVRVNTGAAIRVPASNNVQMVGQRLTAGDVVEVCAERPVADARLYLFDGWSTQPLHAHTFLVVNQKSWC